MMRETESVEGERDERRCEVEEEVEEPGERLEKKQQNEGERAGWD